MTRLFSITLLLVLAAASLSAQESPANYIFYQHAAWAPDGSRLAVSVLRKDKFRIYLMDPDGTDLRQLTDGEGDMWASWAPDNKRIVYAARKFGSSDIWLLNIDGSFVSRLTTSDGEESMPSWSFDGSHIAYRVKVDGRWQIFVMNADGSDQRQLVESTTDDHNPRWSPDGTRVLYYASAARHSDTINVVNADGGGQKVLADGTFPDWSPDGGRIVFGFQNNIYLMNEDGSERVRFVDDGFCPTWSRDGTKIAFIRRAKPEWPTPSEVLIVSAVGPQPVTITGKKDTSLKTVSGQVTRIDNNFPRDGGLIIHLIERNGKPVRLFLAPPSSDTRDMHRLAETLRAGDKVEAKGRIADNGYAIEHLTKLPGTINRN